MILKYHVPKEYLKRFNNKKTIYCLITEQISLGLSNKKIYKAVMINYKNISNMFHSDELEEINLWDKIKIKLGGYENEYNRKNKGN